MRFTYPTRTSRVRIFLLTVLPPLPKPAAQLRRKPSRRVAAGGPAWGWLEFLVLSQTVLPALLFVPGMSAVRTPTRIAAYLVAPLAWVFVAWRGRGDRPGARSFPARPWLMFCTVWLTLSILHPDAYSLDDGHGAGGALHLDLVARVLGSRGPDVEPADPPAAGDPVSLQRGQRAGGSRAGLPPRGLQSAGHPRDEEQSSGART